MILLIGISAVAAFVAGGTWMVRSLFLPPKRDRVRDGWKPERRD